MSHLHRGRFIRLQRAKREGVDTANVTAYSEPAPAGPHVPIGAPAKPATPRKARAKRKAKAKR